MNLLKDNHKRVAFVTLCIAVLTAFTYFVVELANVGDITSLKDFLDPESYRILKTPWNIEFSFNLFALLNAIGAFIILFKFKNAGQLRSTINGIIVFWTVGLCASISYTLNLVVPEFGSEPFGVGIAASFFLALTALLALIDTVLNAKGIEIKKYTGYAVSISFILAMILCLANIEDGTSGSIITVIVFLFITSLATLIYFLSYKDGMLNESLLSGVVITPKDDTPIQNITLVNKDGEEATDPGAELRKLKALKDEGILSEEEYNEKRQKYIDKL